MGEDETSGISTDSFESIHHLSTLTTSIKINSTCIKYEGSVGLQAVFGTDKLSLTGEVRAAGVSE